MDKSEFLKSTRASLKLEKVVGLPDGMPDLYARCLPHGQFSDMFEIVTINGKKDTVLNYSKAMLSTIVDQNGSPYFTKDDLPALEDMGTNSAAPFVMAINKINGLNLPKAETDAAN